MRAYRVNASTKLLRSLMFGSNRWKQAEMAARRIPRERRWKSVGVLHFASATGGAPTKPSAEAQHDAVEVAGMQEIASPLADAVGFGIGLVLVQYEGAEVQGQVPRELKIGLQMIQQSVAEQPKSLGITVSVEQGL